MKIFNKTFDSQAIADLFLNNKTAGIITIDIVGLLTTFAPLSASQFTHLLCVLGGGVSMATGLVVLFVIIAGLSYWLDKYGYEAAITEGLELAGKAVNMYDDAKEYLSNLF